MSKSDDQKKQFRDRYGPWAVVTGASSGIGKELAIQLASCGLNLVLVARRAELLEPLAASLESAHAVSSRVVVLDLSHRDFMQTLIGKAADLDIGLLIASAGFGTCGALADSDILNELEMLDVNCRALLQQTRHFSRRFAERGRGGMILLSSIVAFQGNPWSAHYSATKAYVQSLAEGLALELAPRGVDVVAVAPGPTATGFASRAGLKMGKAMNPADLAWPILRSLGRRTTVLPGFLSKLLTYSLATLPRWARVHVMGMVMKGMT